MTNDRARRVRQPPQQRRKQLIGIGLAMLTRRPLHQITIDEVAAEAGISRSLLFHYFPTKRDYYAEVVRAASRRLLRATEAGVDGSAEIADIVEGYLSFIERRHEPYVALFRSPGTDDWVHEIFVETRGRLVDQLLRALHVSEPSDLVRASLGAWLSFAEELALQWAKHGVGSRDDVLAVLTGALRSVADIAQATSAPAGSVLHDEAP